MSSISAGEATPSSSTISASRLIAAQTRLWMKPMLSPCTRNGLIPKRGSSAISRSMIAGSV